MVNDPYANTLRKQCTASSWLPRFPPRCVLPAERLAAGVVCVQPAATPADATGVAGSILLALYLLDAIQSRYPCLWRVALNTIDRNLLQMVFPATNAADIVALHDPGP